MKDLEKQIEEAAFDFCWDKMKHYNNLSDVNITKEEFKTLNPNLKDDSFIHGAKSEAAKKYWQQGMYSEEEVKELFYHYTDCNMDPHDFENFNNWFEQNKKK